MGRRAGINELLTTGLARLGALPGWVAFRVLVVGALACAALVLLPSASGRNLAAPCGRYPFSDSSTHWEAVFGHRTSVAEANLLRRQLEAKAIKGIQLERDYCDDIELEIPGVDSPADRAAFFDEAHTSGVGVVFESPDSEKPNPAGQASAVFGHRPTLKRASDLLLEVSAKGWREADLVRVTLRDWKVLLRHVPQSGESDFAAEARGGGYTVTFEG